MPVASLDYTYLGTSQAPELFGVDRSSPGSNLEGNERVIQFFFVPTYAYRLLRSPFVAIGSAGGQPV